MTPQSHASLVPLLDAFDAFIFDQWGVLHEGNRLYGSVLQRFAELRVRGKYVGIVTNSSKSDARNERRLEQQFGLARSSYDVLVSTAEILRGHLISNSARFRRVAVFADEGDEMLLDGLDIETVSVDCADAIVLLSAEPRGDWTQLEAAMREGAARSIPLMCPSADTESVRPDGVASGLSSLTRLYANSGGKVLNFGKPSPFAYDLLRAAIPAAIPDHRVLAIGDQIYSDVRGARRAGWATALMSTGASVNLFPRAGWPQNVIDAKIDAEGVPDYLVAEI